MVVAHGHFSTLAPLLEGPLCLVEEEVGTFSHGLGLHGGESPWLAMSKSGAPHSLAARCLLPMAEEKKAKSEKHLRPTSVRPGALIIKGALAATFPRSAQIGSFKQKCAI